MDRKNDTYVLFKLGAYTGDGTRDQAITGVGFRPKYLEVYCDPTTADDDVVNVKLDLGWGRFTSMHMDWGADHENNASRIISVDNDGFSVDDYGSDFPPNKDGVVYHYVAMG